MRILYVEDNEVNQALVGRVARARKCSVVFCEEGEAALDALAADSGIDLVLLDIELAGPFSGLDVVRTMRERSDHRPVVAITAYAMMGDRERILEAGCDHYLPKPVVVTDLLALIDRYEQARTAKPVPAPAAAPAPAEAAANPPTSAVTPAPAPTVAPAEAAPVAAAAPSAEPDSSSAPIPVPLPDAEPVLEAVSSAEPVKEDVVPVSAAPAPAEAKATHERSD